MKAEINEKLTQLHQKLEDDQFREKFMASPKEVFAEEGIPLPDKIENATIVVYEEGQEKPHVENSDNVVFFPIPPKGGMALSDDDLEQASGGGDFFSASSLRGPFYL